MKLEKDKNDNRWYIYFDKEGNSFVHLVNDWEQLIPKKKVVWNWIEFRFLNLAIEKDVVLPGWEFILIVLGMGIRARINLDWSKTKEGRDLLEDVEKIKGKNRTF